jgi:hypothetical protein
MIASRLLARWSTAPSEDHRDAVAHPAAPARSRMPGDARSLGTLQRFESAVMPEVSGRGVPDLVHGGSDDLLVWPPSVVERQLAAEWCATGEPGLRDELYALAGSTDRAEAIGELVYLEQRIASADALLARAFGQEPPDRRSSR